LKVKPQGTPVQIGELARRSGLSPSRIRFYEAQGLVSADRRANGYRAYPDEALMALTIVTSAQDAGFTLDEIRRLMPGDLAQCRDGALLDALRAKLGDIGAMQQRLARTRSQIEALIVDIEARPAGISCEANTDRVLGRFKTGLRTLEPSDG
jgi:DNA-binding transcriptional MerR regulator